MKKQKVIYYKDELNDDFSKELNVKTRKITGDYKYLFGKNVFKHFFGFILYRLIATPVVYIYMYLFRGLRVKNRKALKKIKGGYFLYANHTQVCADAFSPSIVTFPKKAEILVHPDAVSIPETRRAASRRDARAFGRCGYEKPFKSDEGYAKARARVYRLSGGAYLALL